MNDRDDLPLPTLQIALLSPEKLARLLDDIEGCADQLEVCVKWASTERTPNEVIDLVEARRALERGTAFGIQLRYRFGGEAWCDTLMRVHDGVRLVRIGGAPDPTGAPGGAP